MLFNRLAGGEHLETFYWLMEPLGNFLVVLRKKQQLLEIIGKFCQDMKVFIFRGFTLNENKSVPALTKYI